MLPTSNLESLAASRKQSAPDHVLTVKSGPPLPPGFEKVEGKHPFFFKKWKFDKPLVAREPVQMLTNVSTFDPEFLRFLERTLELSKKHMPVDLDDEGFVGPSHIHKTTSSFGTVSGWRQNPMAYSLRDNFVLRDELGLPNSWRCETDRQIYREWLHLFFSAWCDRPIKVTKKSKSGPPHMEYEADKKIRLIEDRLEDAVFTRILKLIRAKKMRDLRKDHQCIAVGVAGRRGQSDDAEKVRLVADELYARTGGREGRRVPTDKRVEIDGHHYATLSAQRVRQVIGYSTILNSFGQMMSTGHLYAAYDRFAPTLKFAELQDKVDSLDEFLPSEPILTCFAADVDNFDNTAIPEFRWLEIIDVMRHYWDDGMVELQDMLHRAPYCSAPLELGGEFYWSGNPDDPAAFDSKGALKSGSNMVTIIGILEIVGEFLTNCNYAFNNVKGNVRRILEGDYILRLWDKGDDHVIWGAPDTVARYEKIATASEGEKLKYAYFRVSAEPGKQFIGHIIQRLGPRKFKALPRIHSLHDKTYCNEHSVGTLEKPSVFRPCWPIGAFVRKMLYGNSSALPIYNDVTEFAWKESGALARYGSVDAILNAAMDRQTSMWRLARNSSDMDVLISPQKLDYRYHEDQISPEVVSLFKSSLNQDLTTGWVTKLYGGVIIPKI